MERFRRSSSSLLRRLAAAWPSHFAVRAWRRPFAQVARLLAALVPLTSCADRARPTAPEVAAIEPPTVSAAVNVAPTALFAISPRWPAPGDTVTFDARYSVDSDGQVVQYNWDLGNGSTQIAGAQARTVFRLAGTYTISLVARDDSNATATASMALTVGATGAPAGSVSASQSQLTLSSGSIAAGTATSTATVTVRNASGGAVSGVPVRLGSEGRAVAITQPGNTPGSGIVSGTLSSRTAQSATIRAIADYVLLDAAPTLTIAHNTVSTLTSSVRRTDSLVTRYGDSTMYEVTARDAEGNPVSGANVSVSMSGGTATVSNEGPTDASGRRIVRVFPTSCSGTVLTPTVSVGVTALPSQPTVTATTVAAYGVCGPSMWFDASDAPTVIASAGILTQWRDKSGFARHASTAAGPTVTANGMAGRTVLRFNGTSNAIPIADVIGGTSYTILMVERRRDSKVLNHVLGGSGSGAGINLHFGYHVDGTARLGHFGDDIDLFLPGFTSIGAEPARTWSGRWQPGVRHLRINASTPSVDANTAGVSSWPGASIGQFLGTNFYSGDVAEIVFFRRALTDSERLAAEHALMVKWGVGTFAVDQGNSQSAVAGSTLPIAPRVRVTNASGAGIPNATVTWQITAGGGSASTSSSITDSNGYASVSWALGSAPGTNTLVAWYSGTAGQGQSATFSATGESCAYTVCGVSLWLDATSAGSVSVESGNRVTQWNDLSGYDRHAAMTSGSAARPTLTSSSALGGRTAITFDPAFSQFLTTSVAVNTRTVMVVHRQTTEGAAVHRTAFSVRSSGVNTTYPQAEALYVKTSDASGDYAVGFVYATSSFAGPVSIRNNGFSSLLTVRVLSASAEAATNRATAGSQAFTGTLLPRDGVATIGASYWNNTIGDLFSGQIGEVVTFDRTLTTTERDAVERALMAKWGLGTFSINAGNSQSATAGTSPATAPRVRLLDAGGAGVPDATVTWQVTGGGGRLNGGTQLSTTTDASGFASVPVGQWILDAGTNTIRAWLSGTAGLGESVQFMGTGTLPSGLQLRVDASDTSSVLSSSACTGSVAAANATVGCWLDRSGNAANAVQTTSTSRPTRVSNGINGRNAMQFTLAAESWFAVTAAAVRGLRSTSRTIVAALQAGAAEGTVTNEAQAIAIWPGYHNGLFAWNDGSGRYLESEQYGRLSGGSNTVASIIGVPNGPTFVAADVTSYSTSTTWAATAYLNGVASNTDGATDASNAGATDMRIGQGNVAPTTTYRWRLNGRIGELLVFNRALTGAERLQVERYLGWKWGVTVQ
jgi:large repetitive protein